MIKNRLSTVVLIFVSVLLRAQNNSIVTHVISKDSLEETWEIINPPVIRNLTPFTDIQFKSTDEVIIDAGGCVRSNFGGWRRYIGATGKNSDRLYSGLIKIPGLTADLDKITNYMGRSNFFHVPPHTAPENLYLSLGYADDYYEDNGYDNFEDCADSQCEDEKPAWVRINIIHHTVQPNPTPPSKLAPMTVVWDSVDDNFLPLNPMFEQERQNEHPDVKTCCLRFPNGGDNTYYDEEGCSRQADTIDEPVNLHSLICQCDHAAGTVHGHVNWFNVSTTGYVYFQDWQKAWYEDDDIDLFQATENGNGVLVTNDKSPPLLGLEFNYSETIRLMDVPWWNRIDRLLQRKKNWDKIEKEINRKPVYVSGLFGIDNQHKCRTEIHPVHFLAIKYGEDTLTQQWAFFARNSGTEGFCSQDEHDFYSSSYRFFIPNARDVVNKLTHIKTNDKKKLKCIIETVGDGLMFNFPMPPLDSLDDYFLWYGQITVNKLVKTPPQQLGPVLGEVEEEPEDELDDITSQLNEEEMKQWEMEYKKQLRQTQDSIVKASKSKEVFADTIPPPKPVNIISDMNNARNNVLYESLEKTVGRGRLSQIMNVSLQRNLNEK